MAESMMGKARDTWLKAECVDIGMSYIDIAHWIDGLAEEMMLEHRLMVPLFVEQVRINLDKNMESGLIDSAEVLNIMGIVKEYVDRHDYHSLVQYADKVRVKALEGTVRCQSWHEPTLHQGNMKQSEKNDTQETIKSVEKMLSVISSAGDFVGYMGHTKESWNKLDRNQRIEALSKLEKIAPGMPGKHWERVKYYMIDYNIG